MKIEFYNIVTGKRVKMEFEDTLRGIAIELIPTVYVENQTNTKTTFDDAKFVRYHS